MATQARDTLLRTVARAPNKVPTVQFSIRIPEPVMKLYLEAANKRGCTINVMISDVLVAASKDENESTEKP